MLWVPAEASAVQSSGACRICMCVAPHQMLIQGHLPWLKDFTVSPVWT